MAESLGAENDRLRKMVDELQTTLARYQYQHMDERQLSDTHLISDKIKGSGVSAQGITDEKLDILLRCTNINVKIIACLQAADGLNEDQVSEIETAKALRKQCQLLYGWMKNNVNLMNCFVKVMEENEQSHVANFLKGNNEEPHVPLSNSRYERMIRIKPKLMDSIHYSEEFISILEAMTAISNTDSQDVRGGVLTRYKKNYTLINAIQRRSDYSFICFEHALRRTYQDHAANYLYEGEVVAVHVNTNHPELDNTLSRALNDTIMKEYMYATQAATNGTVTLNGMHRHLLSSKPGKSIVMFFYYKTMDDMAMFMEAFNSGQLESKIQLILNDVLFNLPNNPTDILDVELRLDDEELLLIEEFTGIEDWMHDRFLENKRVDADVGRVPGELKYNSHIGTHAFAGFKVADDETQAIFRPSELGLNMDPHELRDSGSESGSEGLFYGTTSVHNRKHYRKHYRKSWRSFSLNDSP